MINFLFATPALSHALLAMGYTLVLGAIAGLLPPLPPVVWAAIIVSGVFYAREAGQHEHDLKNRGVGKTQAFLGAVFFYRWDAANWVQWGTPAAASSFIAAVTVYTGKWVGWSFIRFPG